MPREVAGLNAEVVQGVACGYGHTVVLTTGGARFALNLALALAPTITPTLTLTLTLTRTRTPTLVPNSSP